MKIFVGHWYTVTGHGSDNAPEILLNKELLDRPVSAAGVEIWRVIIRLIANAFLLGPRHSGF